MKVDPVRAIADAVLYEGYLLWPYRRSATKNQRRWTFGGVYPRSHSERHPDDRCTLRTECLLEGDGNVTVDVRFLHVVARQVLRDGEPVDELVAGGERHLSWDEAVERELTLAAAGTRADRDRGRLRGGAARGRRDRALLGGAGGQRRGAGGAGRRRSAADRGGGREHDAVGGSAARGRAATHVLLHARGPAHGRPVAFISQTDPPASLRAAAELCRNEGAWPVLVDADDRTVLASPIILEDHPRIAPESPGDLFDGGEIDQMLVLNILSLTDAEKAEMRDSDPRAREILERTEALTEDELMRLHGAIREFGMAR